MNYRSMFFLVALVTTAGAANVARADIPLLNATCPGQVEVHADEGGPVYVNGKEARLKRFNDNYYEARSGNLTISLTIRPDGSSDVSYTRKGGANGVCQVERKRSADDQPSRNDRTNRQAGVDTSAMSSFCRGEASAEFDRRPSEITTNVAFRSGNRYVVQGNYTDGARTTFFNCWFDANGSFVSIN